MPLVAMRAAAQDTAGEKILRIQRGTYPDTIDPQVGSALAEISIWTLNYEGLTRLDGNLQTVPAAAESWEFNADATSITFRLREGLTYSDGSPLTADRFRYSLLRTCDPNVAGGYAYVLADIVEGCADFANLLDPEAATPVAAGDTAAYEAARDAVGVRAPDERTLEVDFTDPAPYFPTVASLWVLFPAKEELIEAGGANWWADPANQIGNGPFQVNRLEEGQLAAFEANENYWAGRPKVDGIEYVYISDSAAALEAYRSGDVDIIGVDPSQISTIQADPAIADQLLRYPAANTWYLNFNLNQEPFQDLKVREAFAYAFDRETFCEVISFGSCVPTYSWVPSDVPGAIETEAYKFDPEAARAALAASSYGGPEALPEIRYYYGSGDAAAQARVEWIAQQYREHLGVELVLEPTESTTLQGLRRDPETYPQFTIYNWYQDYPDPQNWLSVYWTCNSTFAERVGYCNPEFDELTQQGDRETDPAARIPFYEQAGQLLLEDLPGPPLFNEANIFLVNPAVTGYTPTSIDGGWPGERASALTVDVNR
jgi:oligopeptide transport system substrate-binding protein